MVLEHLELLANETKQRENIEAEARLEQAREDEQNQQQLLHLEQCDLIDFLLLQTNQPLSDT